MPILSRTHISRLALCAALPLALAGCASNSFFGASGPSVSQVTSAHNIGVPVIDVDAAIAQHVESAYHSASFAESLGNALPVGTHIEPGDSLHISIYEAPPAVLFTQGGFGAGTSVVSAANRNTDFDQIVVQNDGLISLPYVGTLNVAGHTPMQVEKQIEARLSGKAHLPQALVSLVHNASTQVTVMGDVNTSQRLALTPKGERVLDALASAGGVRQPVSKVLLQVTRGDIVSAMPLEDIIKDPRQNIVLAKGDVVTALAQTLSYTALGATGKNEEVAFEARGISLAQALGRSGGVREDRGNMKGVFVFRYEQPNALQAGAIATGTKTKDGKVPVVYRFNLQQPGSFFVLQSFPVRDHDVLFVSNAPSVGVEKFLGLLGSALYPVTTLQTSGVPLKL